MKREYSDPQREPNPNNNNTNNAMFSNVHRHLLQPYTTTASSSPPIHFHHHHQQQNPNQPFPFPLISREVDDESSTGAPITQTPPNQNNPTHSQSDPKHNNVLNDGATIEVQRRPRGRPPGSKNRPKPPVIITRELPDPILSPYILEISNSADVIDSISKFAIRRNTGLTILHASGAVANVTIRQPTPNSSSTVTFHGRFDILSLDATFLTQMTQSGSKSNFNVSISLSVPQGQVIGGIVSGPLIASGTVYVIAGSFSRAEFQRLPIEEEGIGKSNENVNTVSSGGNEQESPSGGGAGDNNGNINTVSSGGMYNLGSDVIWAPAARQPY